MCLKMRQLIFFLISRIPELSSPRSPAWQVRIWPCCPREGENLVCSLSSFTTTSSSTTVVWTVRNRWESSGVPPRWPNSRNLASTPLTGVGAVRAVQPKGCTINFQACIYESSSEHIILVFRTTKLEKVRKLLCIIGLKSLWLPSDMHCFTFRLCCKVL